MICIARCKTNKLVQCKSKRCTNSNFCKKHQNYNEKTINEELFTNDEIKLFIFNCTYNTHLVNINKTIRNNILIAKYILQSYNYKYSDKLNITNTIKYFKQFIKYYDNLQSIIKIQSLIRMKYILKINKYKGPGLLNKCINDTDFYTFEEKKNISYNYLFSYSENNNQNIYFFDIRSFKLLIENNTNNTNNTNNINNIINPYNRKVIPNNIINNYNKIIKHLLNQNIDVNFEDEILTEEQIFNQKIINIFQKIDAFGYNTSIEWFTQLSLYSLKNLWAHLEDIWNYRSNLNYNEKDNIIQKNKQQPFYKFKYINKNIEKCTLQNYILDDINIFITSGKNSSFSNIGCLYVLTALSYVSKECIESMPWLTQI
jgi:hypothetical protein